jgi:hypothetical protein
MGRIKLNLSRQFHTNANALSPGEDLFLSLCAQHVERPELSHEQIDACLNNACGYTSAYKVNIKPCLTLDSLITLTEVKQRSR